MRTRLLEYGLAFALLFAVATTVYGFVSGASARQWEARATLELERAEAARERSRELLVEFAVVEKEADSLAVIAYDLGVQVRDRVADVRELAVSEACAPVVAIRDAIIDTLIVESDIWHKAYDKQVKATELLQVSYGIQSITLDSLTAVLTDRPLPRPRWVPSMSPGVFAGVCSNGLGCVGFGVTLSWRIL